MNSAISMNLKRWCRNTLGVAASAALAGCVVRAGPGFVAFAPNVYAPPPPPPYYYAPPPPPAEEVPPPAPVQTSSDEDLQRLVAPVALYPDPLLADVLAASTYPDQIQAAAQWVASYPNSSDADIAAQPWDQTVQALCHYPTVLNYMAQQIDWTRSLGSAFSSEQADVMASVQDLRAQAYADGSLHDTPEQRVVVVGDPTIYILPVDPGVIYVPSYDPVLVYQESYPITFGVQFVAGPWLVHGFDWDDHYVFYGDWRGGWDHGPYGWRRDPYWVRPGYYHPWARDRRWGPAPHVDHFAFRAEVARGAWHPVGAAHRADVRGAREARPEAVRGSAPGHSSAYAHPQAIQKKPEGGAHPGGGGSEKKKD